MKVENVAETFGSYTELHLRADRDCTKNHTLKTNYRVTLFLSEKSFVALLM